MPVIAANTWVPTGNDYVIDGLWGRLGVQENFGETTVSGATNALAVKDAGEKVFLYAGSANGGIHLRIYDKTTDSWGDRWEWISKPGSGYTGSQSIGALSISEDGKYLAVGQGNPSNGKGIAAQSQGLQIGGINDDGSIEWLRVDPTALADLQGNNIRSLAWDGARLRATSFGGGEGNSIIAVTSADGIISADVTKVSSNNYLSRGGDYIVVSAHDNKLSLIGMADRGEGFNLLIGDKYERLIKEFASKQNIINRVAVQDELVNGELIAFVGGYREEEGNQFISAIARLKIDPATRELLDYRVFDVKKNDIGTNQAGNIDFYGNFSFAVDPYDPTANSIYVGGNMFLYASLRAPTVGGGLVRVDFSGDEAIITDTLYGPKIDTTNGALVEPFSPGQPHADSRTVVFYESATGPRLIQSDDGGIWELQLDASAQESKPASDAWWESLTTKGLNTLEMNVGAWNAATNSIAAAYQDNAASLGYFGDDHATNFWVADGTLALFDDGANQADYLSYLSHYDYIYNGTLAAQTYSNEGYITGRRDAVFLFQRTDKSAPIPWKWNQAEQAAQDSYKTFSGRNSIFNVPVQSNAYQQGIVLAGFANIYEQIKGASSMSNTDLELRPLLMTDVEDGFLYATALDYQGTPGQYQNQSLYVAGNRVDSKTKLIMPFIYGRQANDNPTEYALNSVEIDFRNLQDKAYNIIDLAHASTNRGDVIYWIQEGNSIAFGDVGKSTPADQTLNIRDPDGQISTYRLSDYPNIIQSNDPYGYQTLTYVPAQTGRAAMLVIGGLNGPYYIELNDQGLPQNPNLEFIQMPWQSLPDDSSPGSYIRSMEYDPHDDLLFAATQGQGGFIYSFSGDLGEGPKSNELLHVSDITLLQLTEAALDKRGNELNSTITVQLNSELQAKDAPTEVEIILHDADAWRESMQLVSPYNIMDVGNETEKQYLNILDPLGLEYRGGREEDGNIIMPFTFPAGVSLYNLIVNQNKYLYPNDPISLSFSVRTIDGGSQQSAKLELVPTGVGDTAIFDGIGFDASIEFFEVTTENQSKIDQAYSGLPSQYQAIGSTVEFAYSIATSADSEEFADPAINSEGLTRVTIPIDTYAILRASPSLTSFPNLARWPFAMSADSKGTPDFTAFTAYDPTTGLGSRFYDLSGDGYPDRLSISGDISQSEYTKNVKMAFGSVVVNPVFQEISDREVLLRTESDYGLDIPLNIRVSASIDLGQRSATTSSLGYIVLPDDGLAGLSANSFADEARLLIHSFGKSVDLSAIPESDNFTSEILINTGQRVMFFELEGASLNQLTGLDDPRLIWFESTVVPDQDGKNLALRNQNQTELTVHITPGIQGLNTLIADLQNQVPILDFTAIDSDQTITGTLAYGREAALDSSLGWYIIDRPDGAITAANGETIMPGDADYTQEALRADNLIDSLTGIQIADRSVGQKAFSIKGGILLAPFARVSNGETYFGFSQANSDRLQHFYSLGTNKFGFEDLNGGGDRDFQDLVQMFNFSIDPLT